MHFNFLKKLLNLTSMSDIAACEELNEKEKQDFLTIEPKIK